MTTATRFLALAACLAALEACVVSTDDLAPKTAAQCQAWEKACGYRCVNADDPATGCGNASCEPVDIQADAAHCGACGHACVAGACSAGVCAPEAISRGTADLRGVTVWNGDVYWLEGTSGGQLVRWTSTAPFTVGNVSTVVTLLDARTSPSVAPSANRIASRSTRLYVAGSGGALPTDPALILWEIDPGGPTKTSKYSDALAPSTTAVNGIAATADGLYFTRSDAPGIFFSDLSGAPAVTVVAGVAARGLAPGGSDVYYGYGASSGTLARANRASGETIVSTFVGTQPDRLAVLQSGGVTQVYFASEVDASARLLNGATLVPLYGGSGIPNPTDIAADASGAYFFDRNIGELLEWRADGWLFPLARGVTPYGVAADATWVYWTDGSGSLMRVPK